MVPACSGQADSTRTMSGLGSDVLTFCGSLPQETVGRTNIGVPLELLVSMSVSPLSLVDLAGIAPARGNRDALRKFGEDQLQTFPRHPFRSCARLRPLNGTFGFGFLHYLARLADPPYAWQTNPGTLKTIFLPQSRHSYSYLPGSREICAGGKCCGDLHGSSSGSRLRPPRMPYSWVFFNPAPYFLMTLAFLAASRSRP